MGGLTEKSSAIGLWQKPVCVDNVNIVRSISVRSSTLCFCIQLRPLWCFESRDRMWTCRRGRVRKGMRV